MEGVRDDLIALMPRTARTVDSGAERRGVDSFLQNAHGGGDNPLFPPVFRRRDQRENRRAGSGRNTRELTFEVAKRVTAGQKLYPADHYVVRGTGPGKENNEHAELLRQPPSAGRLRRDVFFSVRRKGTGRQTMGRRFNLVIPERIIEEEQVEVEEEEVVAAEEAAADAQAPTGISLTAACDLQAPGMDSDSDMDVCSSEDGQQAEEPQRTVTVDASTDCDGLGGDIDDGEVMSHPPPDVHDHMGDIGDMGEMEDMDDVGGAPLDSPSPPRAKKPRGPRYQKLKEEYANRKSLQNAGLTKPGEEPTRRSTRTRMKPLEYWRGEEKIYGRVHNSLATVVTVKEGGIDYITSTHPTNSKGRGGKRKGKVG
mmetsp:Transcript_66966/g.212027  ORF Transcript_66966/g.212027 Transcript_66966/m.212027 type:complete len:368 (+) Transcript_66966:149-1252(+)